jgi:hypothetical protein
MPNRGNDGSPARFVGIALLPLFLLLAACEVTAPAVMR